jgi:hypothetical protein
LIHGRKAQCCNSFHNQSTIAVEYRGRKNIQRRGTQCVCLIDSRWYFLAFSDPMNVEVDIARARRLLQGASLRFR